MEKNLSFGVALEALKSGKAISREGWNGKNMCLTLNKGSHHTPTNEERPSRIEGVNSDMFEIGHEGTVTRIPNINMKTASGSTVTGWLASQTDMLANDWCILD